MVDLNRLVYYYHANKRRVIFAGIGAALLLLAVSLGGYYYWQHSLEQEQEEARLQIQTEYQNKVNRYQKAYQKGLSGGSLAQAIVLMHELVYSQYPFSFLGYQLEKIACTETCAISYTLPMKKGFANLDKFFWGKRYTAVFANDRLDFNQLPSRLGSTPLLSQFKDNQPVKVPSCNLLLNYLYAYNRSGPPWLPIALLGLPSSSVTKDEEALPEQKNRGLLFTNWSMTGPFNITWLASQLQTLGFGEAFLVNSLVIEQDTFTLQGGLVCKK